MLMEYTDRVSLHEHVVEVAYRDGSIEVAEHQSRHYAFRRMVNGMWIIVSSSHSPPNSIAQKLGLSFEIRSTPDIELYSGKVEIGSLHTLDLNELSRLCKDLCNEAKARDVEKCELLILIRTTERVIEHSAGVAEERRVVMEVIASVVGRNIYGSPIQGSYSTLVTVWGKVDPNIVEHCLREALKRLDEQRKTRRLDVLSRGKSTVILAPDTTAALFHEISHMLDATYVDAKKLLGVQLASPEIEVVDDQTNPVMPTARFFDDEASPTARRVLIESGRVVDLHATRFLARQIGSKGGSAHGLFRTPTPFHTALLVRPGDWKLREIIEETSHGLLVKGVAIATLESGYVRIVPEVCIRIDRGEEAESVKVLALKIPISALKTVSAISRELGSRYSYEKDFIVYEVAPYIRLEAIVE